MFLDPEIEQAVSDYLLTRLDRIDEFYDWSFSLTDFPDENYAKAGINEYERSRDLRDHIYRLMSDNSVKSKDLQCWYVRNWGGVRTNKPETLQLYIDSSYEELLSLRAKGVASWSKILSVRNPCLYAIYDARVALALNSIQKIFNVSNPILFPQLPSRNSRLVEPAQAAIRASGFFPRKAEVNFYPIYLELLRRSVGASDLFDIQDAEMVLFSGTKEFSSIWVE